ncbi:MAG: hypothetical protein IPM04_19370 [Saprospiraceae bacterium]|nr:hypothetical protein [Candidatus Brachybacter algidus]MBK8749898.1 hypothetical protein [Candidatus Brachybacter algidus]
MKFLLSFICIVMFLGCGDECENAVNYYKNQRINLVLKKLPAQGRSFTLYGVNPVTGRDEKYYDSGGSWGIYYKENLDKGDTIVKKEGELKIYIHKK